MMNARVVEMENLSPQTPTPDFGAALEVKPMRMEVLDNSVSDLRLFRVWAFGNPLMRIPYNKVTDEEKQVVCRAKGKKGEGFLAVIFPRKAGEPEPVIESWAGGAGAKIAWKGETHFVLLDTKEREVNADGIKAKAGALVCKTAGGKATSLNRAVFNYADAGGKGMIEDVRFEDIAIEGKILRAFGFNAIGGQTLRGWHFKNVSIGAFGAGQLGGPGRNYFLGDIRDFHFDAFTVGGNPIATAEAGRFDYGPAAGAGFTFK